MASNPLTARGWGTLVGAAAFGVAGAWLRWPGLLGLAAALALLVLLALLLVHAQRDPEQVERSVHPAAAPVGTERIETLSLRAPTPWLVTRRRYTEPAPDVAQPWPAELAAGADAVTQQRRLRPTRRGRYSVGPLTREQRDPLGLARAVGQIGPANDLWVLPRIDPIPAPVAAGAAGSFESAGAAGQRQGGAASDDASVRSYRAGDPLRRVHWPSTAKVGEVMVRREEPEQRTGALVVLDNRTAPHAGDGEDSSFEWAVTAVASLVSALERAGQVPAVRTADQEWRAPHAGATGAEWMMLRLADVALVATPSLVAGDAPSPGGCVAVLAQCSGEDAQALVRAASGRAGTAVLVDTPQFGTVHDARDCAGVALLSERGWRVVIAGSESHIGALLGGPGSAAKESR